MALKKQVKSINQLTGDLTGFSKCYPPCPSIIKKKKKDILYINNLKHACLQIWILRLGQYDVHKTLYTDKSREKIKSITEKWRPSGSQATSTSGHPEHASLCLRTISGL